MRYSHELIGKNAGAIWQTLSENSGQSLSMIEKNTKLKKEDILLALGWLFKEGKLSCEQVGRGMKFYLV
jgi:hypothetical protein